MEAPILLQQPTYRLAELVRYFLWLGTLGFGGPIALVGYMHRDLVERRRWLSEEEYRQGLTLAQLAPGPLAAQLGIYLGFVHYGVWGATLTGLAFVLPSFIMVVLLGLAYTVYGGLPWMQAVFYGVGAAVIGIISLSAYKLTTKAIGPLRLDALKAHWLLWLFFLIMAVVTVITQHEEVGLLILMGLVYMAVQAPPSWLRQAGKRMSVIVLFQTGFWSYEPGTLWQLGLFFVKAGAFVFGSGLAIIPFLQHSVIHEHGWLNEKQFLDAVAVAMITPGPVVITVAFIGFLVAGFPGAVVAALGVFFPCYVFTVLPAPYFRKIAHNTSIKAFVEGITAAVVGALVGSVFVIASRSLSDVPSVLIALASIGGLLYLKKASEPLIILAAALLGLFFYYSGR